MAGPSADVLVDGLLMGQLYGICSLQNGVGDSRVCAHVHEREREIASERACGRCTASHAFTVVAD